MILHVYDKYASEITSFVKLSLVRENAPRRTKSLYMYCIWLGEWMLLSKKYFSWKKAKNLIIYALVEINIQRINYFILTSMYLNNKHQALTCSITNATDILASAMISLLLFLTNLMKMCLIMRWDEIKLINITVVIAEMCKSTDN